MNKFLVIIFAGLVLFSSSSVFAQGLEDGSQQVDDSENLDIIVSYETQSPKTKSFNLVADISSGIDSDRVVVEWMLPRGIQFTEDTESRYSRPSVSVGETTRVQKLVEPRYSGTFEVEVVVTAIKAEVNYVSSDKIEFTFNDDKEILPLSDEYKDSKTIYQITQFGIYSVIGVVIMVVMYLLYRQIRSYRD